MRERLSQYPDAHPFILHPHRTLVRFSLPVLLSLIAEPLTGLADTAFIARLGTTEAAALGAATMLLSSVYWVLFFIAVGTHTEVAKAYGAGDRHLVRSASSVAVMLAAVLGVAVAAVVAPFLSQMATWMECTGEMHGHAMAYLRVRLVGVPASLVMGVCFGAMRGYQDMKTPLWIAVSGNAINIALDPLLIWGRGPVPALGVAGAAWASAASQWFAALWAISALRQRAGWSFHLDGRIVLRLFTVGRDMLIRTGLLTFFLILATRAATRIGENAGAAHLAVRQVWGLTALLLDAYAATAQSLVGYFVGAARITEARRVAAVSTWWSLGTGVVLTVVMLLATDGVKRLLVPPEAWAIFGAAWMVSALSQPINSLSFITDGIHWGTGDYPYLRNATLAATLVGILGLVLIRPSGESALTQVWLITAAWISVRGGLGMLRVWPGIGRAPLRENGREKAIAPRS